MGLLLWWIFSLLKPNLWKPNRIYQFQRPWRETLLALLATACTIGIGQLYAQHLLLPEVSVVKSPLINSLNQLIIFSPFIILLIVRRQPLSTAWLPSGLVWPRLAMGLVMAVGSIFIFAQIYNSSSPFFDILKNVYHPQNLGYVFQVFLQDFSVAVLLVRFKAAVGKKWFLLIIIMVAFLFSAAHYPLKLSQGLSFWVATREVILDGFLVSAIVYVLQRSGDILWFWFLHFAMDMMQFYGGKPG